MGNQKYSFDKLKMFFGEDYKVADGIVISQPTVGDIMLFGEKEFYKIIQPFVVNPTSFRVALWQQGIDWNTMSEYELFYRLILQTRPTPNETSMIFGDLDFSKFKPYERQTEKDGEAVNEVVLINQEQNVLIDESIYEHMACYLRTMLNIFPKTEKVKGKTTKEWVIEEDMQIMKLNTEQESSLMGMISFCLNHPGFKYNKKELKEMGIVEFYDSIHRLLIYESTSSLMKGMYSGFVDTSKIDKKEFNFMRDVDLKA